MAEKKSQKSKVVTYLLGLLLLAGIAVPYVTGGPHYMRKEGRGERGEGVERRKEEEGGGPAFSWRFTESFDIRQSWAPAGWPPSTSPTTSSTLTRSSTRPRYEATSMVSNISGC